MNHTTECLANRFGVELALVQRERKNGHKYRVCGKVLHDDRNPVVFYVLVDIRDRSVNQAQLSDRFDNIEGDKVKILDAVLLYLEAEGREIHAKYQEMVAKIADAPPEPTPPIFTGQLERATKQTSGQWAITSRLGEWIFVKNVGKWTSLRSITLDGDQVTFAVAEYGSTGYAGVFRPAAPEDVDTVTPTSEDTIAEKPKENALEPTTNPRICGRKKSKGHYFMPLRNIGKLRFNPTEQHLNRITRFLDDVIVSQNVPRVTSTQEVLDQESDPTSPLSRFRYLEGI